MNITTKTVSITDHRDLQVNDHLTAVHFTSQSEVTGSVTAAVRREFSTSVNLEVGTDEFPITFFDDESGWTLESATRAVPMFERDTTGVGVLPNGNRVRGYIYENVSALAGLQFLSETGITYALDSFKDFESAPATGRIPLTGEEPTAEVKTTAQVDRPRSLYAKDRTAYDSILTVSNLREQIARAEERLAARSRETGFQLKVLTFAGWAYFKLGENTDVEELKNEQRHRVNMLNQQATADGNTLRFTLDESDTGFRISARRTA